MHKIAQYGAGALTALSVAGGAPAFAAGCQLASNNHGVLENASFHGQEVNEEVAEHLIEQAEDLPESLE